MVVGQQRVVRQLHRRGRHGLAQLRGEGQHSPQHGDDLVEPVAEVLLRANVGPLLHLGPRIGVVLEPGAHPDPAGPDGHDGVATVAELGDLDHAGHHADRRAHVTAADLAPPLDEDDAELGRVGGQAVLDELAVAGLEDVERQHAAREQDRSEREHPQHSHPATVRR